MGLQFKELVVKKEIAFSDLKNKVLAVDSMNLLYQFLTTIRAPDGSLLTDRQGRVTSHLIGLFSRTTSLMEKGLKLAFVFDGTPPQIKKRTIEKRIALKTAASLMLKEATESGDMEEMRKFASRTAVLSKEMVNDAKKLIAALGLPIVDAPSEGEAQTAYMVKKGDAYASVSQDYDNLIFGCPRLVRNLSLEGKRKRAGKFAYEPIKPEIILLQEVLATLHLNLDQLIVLAMLVGTDYNPGGIKGIGPKTGIKLVQEFADRFDSLFARVEWDTQHPDLSWKLVFDTIKNIPVSDDYKLEWKPVQEKEVIRLLVAEHNFNPETVSVRLEKIQGTKSAAAQKGLGSYL